MPLTLTRPTPINRKGFYQFIKRSRFKTGIIQSQVNGMEAILNEWERRGLQDLRHLAYMLATAYHETGATMQAIEEWGKGIGRDYGKKLKMSRQPYTAPDQLYYGRGLVQLTWFENYEKMSHLLKIDLVNNPGLALKIDIAVKIMFEGMLKAESNFGDFTGKCLEQFFNGNTEDWLNARKIINGLDKAELIKIYAQDFKRALAA